MCEGADRSGKSTVAEFHKKKGYRIVHMLAPDKKYTQKGYTGPSYFDDLIELYTSLSGQKIFFDRTTYGELVWSQVFGREPLLTEEDIDYLREIEQQNEATYLYMYDKNLEAHWRRCVDNKEPLTRNQFITAGRLYKSIIVDQYGFKPLELPEFKALNKSVEIDVQESKEENMEIGVSPKVDAQKDEETINEEANSLSSPQQIKLERANAINAILTSRILKKRGPIFDDIETELQKFLQAKLSEIFDGGTRLDIFTKDELMVLKETAKIVLSKKNRS
jgi:hypothetical protein